MAEVVWRPQALRDLEAIEAYYEEVAPDFAPLFVAGAFETAAGFATSRALDASRPRSVTSPYGS